MPVLAIAGSRPPGVSRAEITAVSLGLDGGFRHRTETELFRFALAVLFAPLRTGAAHVVQLGPIGVGQATGQRPPILDQSPADLGRPDLGSRDLGSPDLVSFGLRLWHDALRRLMGAGWPGFPFGWPNECAGSAVTMRQNSLKSVSKLTKS